MIVGYPVNNAAKVGGDSPARTAEYEPENHPPGPRVEGVSNPAVPMLRAGT